MAYYIKQGNLFLVTDENALDIHQKLPAGNYIVRYNADRGQYYLEQVDKFVNPDKIYGKAIKHRARIISTFMQRDNGTGVLLEGEKGSGKTMLAKALSIELAEKHKMPTLIINSTFVGDIFNKFIQDIEQPALVLFDEFEKNYHRGTYAEEDGEADVQSRLLTLFDGVFPSKKLFVLTINDKWAINANLKNRPGRLFYMLSFGGLDEQFIREYCEDNLNDILKVHTNQVITVSRTIDKFNFDMLKSLVEEMNRYNENARDAIEMLNIRPDTMNTAKYTISLFDKTGKEVPNFSPKQWSGNPQADFYVNVNVLTAPAKKRPTASQRLAAMTQSLDLEAMGDDAYLEFQLNDFLKVDLAENTIYFKNEQGFTLGLKRPKEAEVDHYSYNRLL